MSICSLYFLSNSIFQTPFSPFFDGPLSFQFERVVPVARGPISTFVRLSSLFSFHETQKKIFFNFSFENEQLFSFLEKFCRKNWCWTRRRAWNTGDCFWMRQTKTCSAVCSSSPSTIPNSPSISLCGVCHFWIWEKFITSVYTLYILHEVYSIPR